MNQENRQPYFVPTDDSRDRLIRVEENLKHIDKTLQAGLQDIRTVLEHQSTLHAKDYKETNLRLDTLERRVDRVYWLWGVVVFVGSPIMVIVTKIAMHQFGF